jgi:hypothetical protein
MELPPLDDQLSPLTGYTRDHWEAVADGWLSQALRFASPRHAQLRIPGRYSTSGADSDALEGFARSFLIAAARIAGGGDTLDLAARYREGLLAGTEPGGCQEWPRGVDCVLPLAGRTQPIVEAANIAVALHLCRQQLWDALSSREQHQVADWLEHHARRVPWPNNWVLFTAVIEAFLSSAGVDTTRFRSDDQVRWAESWYLGGGWYTDGVRRNIDYYNAWVIHPFLWAWYDMVGRQRDPDAAWRWRQRLTEFGQTYPYLFGGNGSPVFQGRSLTYRTAALAPLWLGEMTGTSTLPPGAVRRLASGVLRYFVSAGVGSDGPLSLGWRGAEHLPLTQHYSGPGSPYFAGMGFLGLALPADHPVWTDAERPQPGEVADAAVALPGAGWLIQSTKDDGVVRLLNHGSDHITAGTPDPDPLYAKLSYSTHTTPAMGAAFEMGVDGELVLELADGSADRRRRILTHRVGDGIAASRNEYRTGQVVSVSIVKGRFEVRCHLVCHTPPVSVTEGGQLVSGATAPDIVSGTSWSWARDDSGLVSAVIGLHGYRQGHPPVETRGAGPLGECGAVPLLRGETGPLYVALHVLTLTDDPHRDVESWRQAVDVTVAGTVVTLQWWDGDTAAVDVATAAPKP